MNAPQRADARESVTAKHNQVYYMLTPTHAHKYMTYLFPIHNKQYFNEQYLKKISFFQCLLVSSMTLYLRITLNTEKLHYSSQEALSYDVFVISTGPFKV